jgi:membrane-associated phospholipid phosphatase
MRIGRAGLRLGILITALLCARLNGDEHDAPCAAFDALPDVPVSQDAPPPSPDPDTYKVPSEPRLFLQDVVHVATGPAHWKKKDWIFLGSAAVGLGVLTVFDKSVTNEVTGRNSTFADDVAKVFEPIGSVGGWGAVAGLWAYGAAFHDARARHLAFDAASAAAISGVITEILKSVVGRGRPNANEGSYSFQPFRNASFPSGHTTQAFAFAAVVSSTYEKPWVTAGAYAVAGLVGFARIRHAAHFATDVAAGALIGTATGLSVVHFNKRQRRDPENTPERVILSAAPSADGNGAAMVLIWRVGPLDTAR